MYFQQKLNILLLHLRCVEDNAAVINDTYGATFMLSIFTGLDLSTSVLLLLALLFVLFYEAINGFHDAANAVATVIYTRAMRPRLAVVMSGVFNFFGVLLGGLSVAYAIVHLMPTDLLLNVGSARGLILMFSLLFGAIIWNLLTWYYGLPASSSHTLIGAIIGVGLTNALISGSSIVDALNIPKVVNVFLSLILSPIIGLVIAGGTVLLLSRYWKGTKKRARIHMTPAEREKRDGKKKPPFWTRIALIISAAGVSFSHGANDGQKGIGLIMLVLIGVVPAGFAINMEASGYDISRTRDAVANLQHYYQQNEKIAAQVIAASPSTKENSRRGEFHCDSRKMSSTLESALQLTDDLPNFHQLSAQQRTYLRQLLLCVADTVSRTASLPGINEEDKRYFSKLKGDLLLPLEYAPIWIIFAVALALSLGTMVGWQRIAVTIGEKIGKKEMTYAQGMSAQVTAALSIGIASYTGMPVSTTHILSSSVAGTMLVSGHLQTRTVRNIFLAWVFTMPASALLSGALFWLGLKLL